MKIALRSNAADGRWTKNATKMPTVRPASPIAATASPMLPAFIPLMNAAMIARWNETVGPGDDGWHLGDFALRTGAEALSTSGHSATQVDILDDTIREESRT